MNEMNQDQLNYKTKCRVCGVFNEWYFGVRSQIEWKDFANAIQDKIQFPRLDHCEKCNISTVQDVVSYTNIR